MAYTHIGTSSDGLSCYSDNPTPAALVSYTLIIADTQTCQKFTKTVLARSEFDAIGIAQREIGPMVRDTYLVDVRPA